MRKNNPVSSTVMRFHGIICEIFLLPVKAYRKFISLLKTVPCCRFTPTCSQYALDAVREWGLVIGTILSVWRVIRCNPFSDGGYDPVPKRKR